VDVGYFSDRELREIVMKKIVVVLVVLFASGVVFVLKKSGQTSSELSVVTNIEAAKENAKMIVPLPKAPLADLPVPSKEGPWPKAIAKDLTFAFGRMQVKEKNTHQFVVRNEGQADLNLVTGSTTCKCTQFGFDTADGKTSKRALVKPGESVTLTMSWKAGEVPDRQFSHGGDVYTDDPENTVLKYAVQGAIEMPFELLPRDWNVGNVYTEQAGEMTATLGSKVYESLEIVSIHSPSGKVTVTPGPITVEMKAVNGFLSGFGLKIVVAPDIPAGIFEEEVEIKLAQYDAPIKVNVSARRQGVLQMQQMAGTLFDRDKMQLQLGSFPASEGREAKLLLIVDEKDMAEPFRIADSKFDPSFLTASLSPLGQPSGTVHRYILTIAVPPGRPHIQRVTASPGTIALSTNHSSGEEINLSVLLYSN